LRVEILNPKYNTKTNFDVWMNVIEDNILKQINLKDEKEVVALIL
jgi:hypothetical protein